MSQSSKCDRCGAFFEHEPGTIQFDVNLCTARAENEKDHGATFQGWTDVDLCKGCAKHLIDIVASACDGMNEDLAKIGRGV